LEALLNLPPEQNQTRSRILEAALERFSREGYHNTSVADIVEDSRTSKGAVYFHFPSKQDIFLGLVDQFANILENRLKKALVGEDSGVNKVNAALVVCVGTFTRYRKLAKIFLIQAIGLGTVFEDKRREIHNRFIDIIQSHLDQAVREGSIPSLDTHVTACAWMGAINEVIIEWVYNGEPDPDQALVTLRRILLRGIGVDEERIKQLP
jgi:AcrR family transcriptional regulator